MVFCPSGKPYLYLFCWVGLKIRQIRKKCVINCIIFIKMKPTKINLISKKKKSVVGLNQSPGYFIQ